jgi:2,4-dienoyl-CoA reductase-like NADH-dependent reductase (Old Yellow Enzyme family)
MTLDQIHTLIEAHAKAARRCLIAGMDMIMIHSAHGHLISQFLSSKSNYRTDAYGGSFKNRARFAMEILEAIRKEVGDRLAIEYRISGDELAPDGLGVEEQLEFARMIQDKIDLIHVSAGKLYEDKTVPRIFPPMYVPRGVNVYLAELFKKGLKIPVTTIGSLNLEMANRSSPKTKRIWLLWRVLLLPILMLSRRRREGRKTLSDPASAVTPVLTWHIDPYCRFIVPSIPLRGERRSL